METEAIENIYKVKTSVFEGPFGVLLSMVEERKLFINDLSLSTVTDDYLRYIGEMERNNPMEVASFMVVAATLILIKSKSLLPNLPLTEEEETNIHNLADRLKLYEMYIHLGGDVNTMFGKRIIFAPLERKQKTVMFLPDSQITKENMMMLVSEVLGRMPKKEILQRVEVKKVISLEEMIEKLTDRIENSFHMSFKEWSGAGKTKEEKVTVVVSFLAMLELVRQGVLDVLQENNFEDIIIKKTIV